MSTSIEVKNGDILYDWDTRVYGVERCALWPIAMRVQSCTIGDVYGTKDGYFVENELCQLEPSVGLCLFPT